jgi:hypothetical protein
MGAMPPIAPLAGENVESDLGPVSEPLREFDRLVLLMVRGIHAVDDVLLSILGVIRMQFEHQRLGRDRLGAVDLDLIIRLGLARQRHAGERKDRRRP